MCQKSKETEEEIPEAVPSPGFVGEVETGRGDPRVLRAWMQDVYARVNEAMIDDMLENFRWVV